MKNILFGIVKNLYFYLLVILSLSSCKSNEGKAEKLIKKEMFKTLHDFSSYEPIETIVDSAFTTIYMDTTAIRYAYIYQSALSEVDDIENEVNDARSSIEIWEDSYSVYGRSQYNAAYEKYKSNLKRINGVVEVTDEYQEKIKTIWKDYPRDFIGWKATHKFRSKSKGGNYSIANYVYYFDKDLKTVTNQIDIEDEEYNKIKEVIDHIISYEESESEI